MLTHSLGAIKQGYLEKQIQFYNNNNPEILYD